jgi:TusA-related sulfurtransferase
MLRIMSSKVDADRTLDCIGLFCPEPVFRTRIELDKMVSNQVLEVIADDPAAEEDIKSLVRRIGHELLRIDKQDTVIHFFIRKKD